MTNLRDLENIETTAAAIDAARNAIDEQRYERAQALAQVAQVEVMARIEAHLVTMNQHLANIANGLAAIHLYGAGHGPTPPSPEERATFWQED